MLAGKTTLISCSVISYQIMNQYILTALFQSFIVCILALVGIITGWWFARRPGRVWIIACAVPFVLILSLFASFRFPTLQFIPPFKWMLFGRLEYALMAFLSTTLFTTPMVRLGNPRLRLMVALFMTAVFVRLSLMPFLAPALLYDHLASLKTKIDSDGVCLQSNHYTCGPAAAVTALHQLSVPATESELALRAHANPFTGAQPDTLVAAIKDLYGTKPQVIVSDDVQSLKDATPFLAVVRYSFLVDHYIVVLEINEDKLRIADPLQGQYTLTKDAFSDISRRTLIVFIPASTQ